MLFTKEEWINALENRHGRDIQRRFSDAVVAVCGLGGLGSNIAVSLARAGIGKLVLIDFDRVDITNLHRQQYKANQIGMYKADALFENLKEISPYIELKKYSVRIDESNAFELLRDCNIICEAFDSPEEKAKIVNFVLENFPEKYLISSSGMAGLGSQNEIKTRKVMKRFYLCGDEKSEVTSSKGLFSSRVALCACHEAHMVLKILAEEYDL